MSDKKKTETDKITGENLTGTFGPTARELAEKYRAMPPLSDEGMVELPRRKLDPIPVDSLPDLPELKK